ncbi:MAG: class I SAM-dependent methyltransferase [Desulfobulbaceae bacterium]|nr:class I SAM-dependent methyltransferase [Desulfobulbaceae bacterium]
MPKKRPRSSADWDQRYVDEDLPWDSGKTDIHLCQFIEGSKIAPCKVLEIGCGTGTNSIWLAKIGFEVVGLDLSPVAINRAKVKAKEAKVNCQWVSADIMKDTVPDSPFSLIFDRGCFHVFDDHHKQTQFARRVAELLEEDGIWLSLIGSADGPPRDSGPPRISAEEIVAAAEPHFEILNLKSTSFDEDSLAYIRAWVLHARRREG